MAIFGKYTAFPHGSITAAAVARRRHGPDRRRLHASRATNRDITRTTVFGKPTAAPARSLGSGTEGAGCRVRGGEARRDLRSVDAAARKVITDAGFGPGLQGAGPAASHRPRHRPGRPRVDQLREGNKTRLEPGMCFSDEPTIAIYGEFGVRLEDCLYITDKRPAHVHQAEPGHRSALWINQCHNTTNQFRPRPTGHASRNCRRR